MTYHKVKVNDIKKACKRILGVANKSFENKAILNHLGTATYRNCFDEKSKRNLFRVMLVLRFRVSVFLSLSLSEDYSGSTEMCGLDSLQSTHSNING